MPPSCRDGSVVGSVWANTNVAQSPAPPRTDNLCFRMCPFGFPAAYRPCRSQTSNDSSGRPAPRENTVQFQRDQNGGTISVQYENECAGGVAFTKTYSGQLVVANSGSGFLNSGDSGSLMVEDVTTSPRAVGLLYAGSSTSAIANPIGEVLQFLGGKLGGTAAMV